MAQAPATAVTEVTTEFDVPARMRDGTVLRANVYRPVGDGPWPVLLTRLPYGKDLPMATATLDPVQVARRGYLVVVQDVRGCFASEGTFVPFREEIQDGHDSVEWAARLPGADGRVGMYGGSYLGFTQWAAALSGATSLKAMAPFQRCADPFQGMYYRGGLFELGQQATWYVTVAGLPQLMRRRAGDPAAGTAVAALVGEIDRLGTDGYGSLPLERFAPVQGHDILQDFFHLVSHPMEADAFPHMNVAGRYGEVRVPSFNIAGWFDCFLQQNLDDFAAMRSRGVPAKLLVGPWLHGMGMNPVGDLSFGLGAQSAMVDLRGDLGSLQLRWFDHWLKGAPNGVEAEPPVKLFVMGANRWREEQDWPLERAEETAWFLHPQGLLSRNHPGESEPDSYVHDPNNPVPTLGGAAFLTPDHLRGPRDQRPLESRPDVLSYTTTPLESDLEVTGRVRVHLWATSSARDTDFVARLCDVFPDGRSISLTDGALRARHREHTRGVPPSPIEPGRPYEYVVDLWSTSNLFRAGHRIRVDVASSSFPRWDRNPGTGRQPFEETELVRARQQVLHDPAHPSRVLLPVMPDPLV
ncbi:MAG: CocE/NonD family hydrolase [Candidatus Dormibacteraeota bacterium]|nr:CocE/NonD family hydrolase [Candidatus Dormibacteraeota bacterium]